MESEHAASYVTTNIVIYSYCLTKTSQPPQPPQPPLTIYIWGGLGGLSKKKFSSLRSEISDPPWRNVSISTLLYCDEINLICMYVRISLGLL